MSKEVLILAQGPIRRVTSYNDYVVNGFRHDDNDDMELYLDTTQLSGESLDYIVIEEDDITMPLVRNDMEPKIVDSNCIRKNRKDIQISNDDKEFLEDEEEVSNESLNEEDKASNDVNEKERDEHFVDENTDNES
ncbi:hypothetical protein GH714_006581 [Hevea brasiliensis]|uniref:Uncharacterized protein n=1 Tax=Hevea brasiliensis TaxID=3981 RepID=A0A6A6K4I1_HEVBR|nr:hypothetical protein GH714_006581 [Hevea brasiliensis]